MVLGRGVDDGFLPDLDLQLFCDGEKTWESRCSHDDKLRDVALTRK